MNLHIGKEIEKKYQESGLKLAEFAKRLNTGTRNIYSIFNRPDINSAQLQIISEVLKFDFFTLYQQQLPIEVAEPEQGGWARKYPVQKKNNVQLVIDLDGTEDQLKFWFEKLTNINKAIAPTTQTI